MKTKHLTRVPNRRFLHLRNQYGYYVLRHHAISRTAYAAQQLLATFGKNVTSLTFAAALLGFTAPASAQIHFNKSFELSDFGLAVGTKNFIDLDGDGDYDALVNTPSGVLQQLNNPILGVSMFEPATPNTFGIPNTKIATAGDLNNDGLPDLLSFDNWQDSLFIHYNNGTATQAQFAEKIFFQARDQEEQYDQKTFLSVQLIDIDADSDLDMVIFEDYYTEEHCTSSSGSFTWMHLISSRKWINNGQPDAFDNVPLYETWSSSGLPNNEWCSFVGTYRSFADIDNDGDIDYFENSWYYPSWYDCDHVQDPKVRFGLNNGGVITAVDGKQVGMTREMLPLGLISLCDLNGDGLPECITPNKILITQLYNAPPVATSLSFNTAEADILVTHQHLANAFIDTDSDDYQSFRLTELPEHGNLELGKFIRCGYIQLTDPSTGYYYGEGDIVYYPVQANTMYDFEQDGWESVFDLHLRYHCDEALCTDTLRYEVFDGATWSPMQGSIYFNAQGFFAAAVSKSSVPSPKTAFAMSSTPQKLLVQLPPSPDDTRLLVSDINGKVLFTQQLPHSDDMSLHQINIGQLPPGVYIAHILGANIRETTKFIRI